MAKETETPVAKPSLSDTNARDNFIAVALREIVADQVAKSKWNADFAATWAVRYANAVMATRAKDTTPLNVVMTKGTRSTDLEVPPAPADDGAKPPKTIDEIIGEKEPVTEVK